MNIAFQDLLLRIMREQGIAVLDNGAKCKALLQDYARGEFKKEIRLVLQVLEAGYHREMLKSEELELTTRKLIRDFQDEYAITQEAAQETISMLAILIAGREKTDEEKIIELEKTAHEGDYKAQYALGSLLKRLHRYEAAMNWFEAAAKRLMAFYEQPLAAKGKVKNREKPKPVLYTFVLIEGGTFMMGSPTPEIDRGGNETQHWVRVSSFYLGKTVVTQREYEEIMGINPSYFRGADLPVEQVSWFDTVVYCNTRSLKEGLTPAYTIRGEQITWNRQVTGYRLPTEAEWEYACRAGSITPFHTGNNITTDQANYDGNYPYSKNKKGVYQEKTLPVGTFAPNKWGLYNMHGNVGEWCWDWYGEYSFGSEHDPAGASSGTRRVNRGGSWFDNGQNLRSAKRGYYSPSHRVNSLGFRILRPISEGIKKDIP
ncbi:MAG: SUMF1/EgtB/PvdO family nonheme iron enzyme [Treponema sp.]|jgi:formylglycine-generating enzyme required for sulfatase activity|nr:SUMF1/EgtB/PvdO family nonheme iron enzyme [Treponema sp.]